ncbi:MAG: transcriptional regulator [Bacteroidetes bacterium]|nr:transcriptional regulator [Bacteroidota bacterium]
MKRSEIFEHIQKIEDPQRDYDKILANLHYTHFFLMDRYKKLLVAYGLTSTQANILGIIDFYAPGSASLEQIKEMVLEPNSDVSRTVTRLAEKGFAEKVTDKENRRKVAIRITPKGKKTLKTIADDGVFHKLTSGLDIAEVKNFIMVLGKLREMPDKFKTESR